MAEKTYVLVHGAWHGGWVWSKVAESLRSRGHRVFTPTLTGCGERFHLLNRDIDLELNIRDILSVIHYEELSDVVLCGHSYAGMIIAAVVDRLPQAVSALVYIEGYVPRHGECVLELRPEADNVVLMEQVRLKGDGWRMPPRSAEDLKVRQPADRLWVDSLLTETALRCFTQPVSLSGGENLHAIKRVYIRAGDYPNERFQADYEHAKASADWESHMIDNAGHDIMVDQPSRLVDVLLGVG